MMKWKLSKTFAKSLCMVTLAIAATACGYSEIAQNFYRRGYEYGTISRKCNTGDTADGMWEMHASMCGVSDEEPSYEEAFKEGFNDAKEGRESEY